MPSKAKIYFLETRPWSFSMTAISVVLAAVAAALSQTIANSFSWLLFVLALAGMLLLHAAGNVINDYFDVKNGIDKKDSPTALYRPHFLLEGVLSLRQVLIFSIILYVLGGLIGVYLIYIRGLTVLYIVLAGGALSYFYSGGPIKYKYRAFGEIPMFLMWGPLMMMGSYYVMTGSWEGSAQAFWLSIPQGLWVALVLLANNIKDIDYDRRVGIRTAGTILSRTRAFALFSAITVGIYLSVALEVIFGVLPYTSLIVFISLLPTIKLLSVMKNSEVVPPDADPRTAQAGMIFGVLLIASLLFHLFLGWG
jgi:1,4-dihydroxy-2-naphthoate octaprenyltransferase